ncbi:30S ribosomal protein S1 [Candidatus Dojkabacteria bacterium CG_4_9_14_3_um_filter_150_Dojkabacteria_WS6_41_13]|uniref:30S ribosomal protein S1 n=1 Tax=Candidatus Dojkabacteria bacterium CG_4_10_14_0_2_um_filter_Dojkabacteria_WS6_41_15 TaxID=2014249 RepID=A0A2M7W2X7_9BACT|nr:MAG: 30S ribosomal protein S1 [Candidatus Dojkabacteria bacterium CG_4_10_14_3_um_filter_Dojkabacteria_WS6_41_9]PJA15430.1 MAG: 30S ribosomal protein S1 [Candidatus Dojkabacteria bacterium CG_4_10_14_0_2_um_filter_Dojkabacteria_WS6_41_15]PJB22889.1 MAG: 30S ribosomal protein S1 [Candidatus Dojkabacteria bacterium CG_4_9_14_3_um_filter_150_Dojkabacteria_WS6_41_13]
MIIASEVSNMNKTIMSSTKKIATAKSAQLPVATSFDEQIAAVVRTYKQLKTGDIVEGVVINKDPGVLVVDVGGRSEGLIAGRELKSKVVDVDAIKVGDPILVYVVYSESKDGSLVLSLKRTEEVRIWFDLEKSSRNGDILDATVVEVNTGGVICELYEGVRGFIPTSQLDPARIFESGKKMYGKDVTSVVQQRLTQLLGEKIKVKIIELDRERSRIILSEKQVTFGSDMAAKEKLLKKIKEGDILDGKVTAITPYGIFVNTSGLEGLVHLSELSWDKVTDVGRLYNVGDDVKVMVLEIKEGGRRIAYSVKRLIDDPWKGRIKKYKIGEVVDGVVEGVVEYGAFVRIDDGINGLIHISELSDKLVRNPSDIVSPGQEVKVSILSISETERHLSLSLKRVKSNKTAES